jgi:hypothetical protein
MSISTDTQPKDLAFFKKQIEASQSLIEQHSQNIQTYESKIYDLLLKKRQDILQQQEELRIELETIENQLLIWEFVKDF